MNRDELKGVNAELEAARTELSNTTNGFDEWVAEERSQEKLRGDGFHYVDAELLDASAPNRPGPTNLILMEPSLCRLRVRAWLDSVTRFNYGKGPSKQVKRFQVFRLNFIPSRCLTVLGRM